MHRITILTKPDCPHCQEALDAVSRLITSHATVLVEEINIEKNPELFEKHHDHVPVIIVDGVERFRGTFDPDQLTKLFYDEFGEKLIGF